MIFAFYVFMAGIFKEFLPINTYVQPTYYGQNILTDNEALASDIIIPSKNASPNNEDKGPTVFIKKVLADNDKDYNVRNADIAPDYKEGDIDAVNVTTLNLSNANIKIIDKTFNDSFAVNVGENTYEFSNLDYSLVPSLDEPYNETVGFHWDWPAHIFKKMYYAVDMGKFIDACVDTVTDKILGSEKQSEGLICKVYPEQIQVGKNGKQSKVTKLNDGAAIKVSEPPQGESFYIVGEDLYIQAYKRIFIRKIG